MKRLISIILSLIILVVPLAGCNESSPTKQLTLSHNYINLSLFGEADIIASYKGVSEIKWSNSNDGVIKMTECGNYVKVTAIAAGKSTITVTGDGMTETCNITVGESDYVLTVAIDRTSSVELNKGGSLYVPAKAIYRGEVVEDAKVIYSTSDEQVATVSADGVVTGVGAGQTELNVQVEYKGVRSSITSIQVTVKDGAALVLGATYFNLYENDAVANKKIYPNEESLQIYLVDGERKITNVDFTITDSNEGVVSVSEDNVIKGLSAGTTVLTVSCEYNGTVYVGEVFVSVSKVPVVSFTLDKTETLLYYNPPTALYDTTATLAARVTVDGKAIAANVTWKVDAGNTAASVSAKGVVKALNVGKSVITAYYEYGGREYTASCNVEVVSPLAYLTSHKFYNRSGVYASVASDTTLVYDEITLTSDKEVPFVRFNLVPDDTLKYNYKSGEYHTSKTPIEPDSLANANAKFVYVTLTDLENEENSITIAIRQSLEPASFHYKANSSKVGVRASSFANQGYFGLGSKGDNAFGEVEKDGENIIIKDVGAKPANMRLIGENGHANSATFSFYGYYLDDLTDKYTIGLSIEGTTIYLTNNDTTVKVWDLKEDTLKFAAMQTEKLTDNIPDNDEWDYSYLTAADAWQGFSSNKVKMSITGGNYYGGQNTFNVMLLDIAGRDATAADVEHMSFEEN